MKASGGTDGADRMQVLIVGAAGQLGTVMTEQFGRDHDVIAWTRREFDLTRHREVHDAVLRLAPHVIINCASYNHVDRAQEEQELALEINAMVVGTLARAAASVDAVFVHYSSDFVFSGTASEPYTEQDAPEPRSVYAQSKLAGEWFAADSPKHYVLRVESLFGGALGKSSVDRIADLIRSGLPAPVFVDRKVSPSYVPDVAQASAHLLRTAAPFGLYHCVNSGHATWFDVGAEIARRLGRSDEALKPISVKDVHMAAPRPQFAALSNRKLAAAGFEMPAWQDAIARYLRAREPA